MSAHGPRVLLVDDEHDVIETLQTSLRTRGYEVRSADDGESGIELFREWEPELVITALCLPKVGGLGLCKAIRSSSDIPIIVLSAHSDDAWRLQALECGADDYVTKPFSADELLVRVRAVLRRISAAPVRGEILEAGDFRVDIASHRAEKNGKAVYLTPKEFELLSYLLRNSGKVLTHKNLLTVLWGRTYSSQADAVYVLVRQLRKKIESHPATPKYLKTESWIGYRFEPGK